MDALLSETYPTARKEHRCEASEYLLGCGYNGMGLSFAELRDVVKAKRNNWKIQPGAKYIKQTGIYEGAFYTFKAIPSIHAICLKHNYYEV